MKLVAELLEHTKINDNAIGVVNSKQPAYRSIYNLKLMELEILKTFIKINLADSFIKSSKSLAGALIFFVWKLDKRFCLCVNYQGVNNLTIKNCYTLPLVGKFSDWLG